MKLVELEDRGDKRLVRLLFKRFHSMGVPRGEGLGRGSRYFVLVVDCFWCAGVWVHLPSSFRPLFMKFNVPCDNSYFLRRICSFCPGQYSVMLLRLLCERLRNEGKEAILTLGLADHSNALYKKAGFVEVGVTPRSKHPVFVKYLR